MDVALVDYFFFWIGESLQVLRIAYNNIQTQGFSAIAACLSTVKYVMSFSDIQKVLSALLLYLRQHHVTNHPLPFLTTLPVTDS
jgi:hypothetical protein